MTHASANRSRPSGLTAILANLRPKPSCGEPGERFADLPELLARRSIVRLEPLRRMGRDQAEHPLRTAGRATDEKRAPARDVIAGPVIVHNVPASMLAISSANPVIG
jgi:hypothetical protein